MSRTDVAAFLTEISRRVLDTETAYMHSMLALNELLRLPQAPDIFTDELKDQARDLWIKLKSTGLHLNDPPLLFGLPEQFAEEPEELEDGHAGEAK